MEAPTKADETMLLPLAQKMGKVSDRCEDKTVRTELVEGVGNTYGFGIARRESLGCYLCRMPQHIFYHDTPFQAQLGVVVLPEAQE